MLASQEEVSKFMKTIALLTAVGIMAFPGVASAHKYQPSPIPSVVPSAVPSPDVKDDSPAPTPVVITHLADTGAGFPTIPVAGLGLTSLGGAYLLRKKK